VNTASDAEIIILRISTALAPALFASPSDKLRMRLPMKAAIIIFGAMEAVAMA
jgi:hypothetical protein